MKKRISWLAVTIVGVFASQAGASIVLRAAGTGSEGNARFTDSELYDIDVVGGVTNPAIAFQDFTVTGSISEAGAFGSSFSMNWGGMATVNTTVGSGFGALATAGGIDRSSAGDLGIRLGVNNGIDQNEGYFFGLDLTGMSPTIAFQITKVAFSTMSALDVEQATFVNRSDTSKTLVVNSNPTNPNVDVSGLDLIVQGGTSDLELLSVFNSSSTPQAWRIISLEIQAIPEPSTMGLFALGAFAAFARRSRTV